MEPESPSLYTQVPATCPRRRIVGFVVDEVIIERVILQAFRCACVIVIPPMFPTRISFTF
jgi:hypothetical protein